MELIVSLLAIPLWAIVYFLSEINQRLEERNNATDNNVGDK